MKILHVILSMAEVDGGPPNGLLVLSKTQANLGDEVCILPCTSLRGKPIIDYGEYGNLTILEPPSSASLKFYDKKLNDVITKIVKNFDIVHIHDFWRYHVISTINAAYKYNIPAILRPAGSLGQKPRRRKYFLKFPYLYIFRKNFFPKISAVHCCSIKEKKELPEWIDSQKIFTVAQPVERDLLGLKYDHNEVYRLCPGVGEDTTLILFLGRISRIKQIPMLVESFISAYKRLENQDVHLVIAGPFEDNKIVANLKMTIKVSGVQYRIHFPGLIKKDIKSSFLSRADFFVLPSIHENFGISVAEALTFGKPCIVNNGVALSSEVKKNNAGLCFDNSRQLTNSIIQLITNKNLIKSCSLNALKLSENFRAEIIANQLKDYYRQFIQEKTRN